MHGVYFEFTTPYLLNKNGIIEWNMRINIEKLCLLMADYNLPKKLWSLGLSITVYLKNWFFIKAVTEGIFFI